MYHFPVIPGREHKLANPESITPAAEYGFRARAFGASRNDGTLRNNHA